MSKIIEELFAGNIAPSEEMAPRTPEQKQKTRALYQAVDALESKLPEPLCKELDAVLDQYAGVCSLEVMQAFTAGFRLGMRLAVEVFHESGLTS